MSVRTIQKLDDLGDDFTDHSTFTVGIHDKIQKILDLLGMDSLGGRLFKENQALNGEADLDQTFAKSFILDGTTFALMQGSAGQKWPEPIRWRRCKEPLEHCFSLRPDQNDAITFVPKCPIYFMGFGQMQNRSSTEDMNLRWSWTIGD